MERLFDTKDCKIGMEVKPIPIEMADITKNERRKCSCHVTNMEKFMALVDAANTKGVKITIDEINHEKNTVRCLFTHGKHAIIGYSHHEIKVEWLMK